MAAEPQAELAPVARDARIDVLDILRGLAILCIFFMNIPAMGARLSDLASAPPALGWGPLDQGAWYFTTVFLEGTQRGLLELLFGAGLMMFARAAMTPDGPVAVADLNARRNLWLLGFGLVDMYVLLWAGDILHIYALAALLLFPFRRVGAKWLLLLGLSFAFYTAGTGAMRYVERLAMIEKAEAAKAKIAAHQQPSAEEKKALDDYRKKAENMRSAKDKMQKIVEMETAGHAGGWRAYAGLQISIYQMFLWPAILNTIAEAFCMMLVGIALWKWRVIQGGRSARFYLILMLAAYAVAVPLRLMSAADMLATLPSARTMWFSQEIGRMAMTIGHLALVNLAVKSRPGRAILGPFKAAGRTAFSLYFLQQFIGLYVLFAPWGLNLWGRFGWFGLEVTALGVIAAQLVLANLWLRFFAAGPLEWLWRSLAYVKRQPFLKPGAVPV